MPRVKTYTPRNYQYGSYYVLLRDREREILKFALAQADHNSHIAAGALGISERHFQGRAELLGGVYPDEPRREPPGPPPRTARYKKAKNAKRDHSAPPTGRKPSHDDRPAESVGGTPPRDDVARPLVGDGDA